MKHLCYLAALLAAMLLTPTKAFALNEWYNSSTHYLWVGEAKTLEGTGSLKYNDYWEHPSDHKWTLENENDNDKVELDVNGISCTVTVKKFFTGSVKITCSSKVTNGRYTNNIYVTEDFFIYCNQVDISLSASSLTMCVGDYEYLQWEFDPATSNPPAIVTFSSENPQVASVDASGHVIALSPGTTIINARTNYETQATCAVQVNPIMVMFITLDKTSLNLAVGETHNFVASIFPDNASYQFIKWTSSDPNVVAVSSNGQILGRAAGTAIITATATDGSNVSASCEVTVGGSGQSSLRGDLNSDGQVDVTDVSDLIDIVLGKAK